MFKANNLQGSQLLRSELEEKLKILQNEMDILKGETVSKEKALIVGHELIISNEWRLNKRIIKLFVPKETP